MDEERTDVESALPILVGEQNPYGGDDYYALYPSPDGCSGHRLCVLILAMRRGVYLEVFQRTNLCQGRWDLAEARSRARELTGKVILCGTKVCSAFGVPFRPFETQGDRLVLPHPSGLNRMWSAANILRARAAVAAFLPQLAHHLGQEK